MNYNSQADTIQDEATSLDIKYLCRICFTNKERKLFVKHKGFSSGYDSICLDCSRAKVKQWRKDNPEKKKEKQRVAHLGSEYLHNKHLKATYKINTDIYNKMFEKQQGNCKVCLTHQSKFKKRLFVDHCHITGKIRGLLCSHCNTLLGQAKDSIQILESAINYLKESTNG